MTLYTLIEKVYTKYAVDILHLAELPLETMLSEIIDEANMKWPGLTHIYLGISFDITDETFDVLLTDNLKQEFYIKYPEALL